MSPSTGLILDALKWEVNALSVALTDLKISQADEFELLDQKVSVVVGALMLSSNLFCFFASS